MSLGSSKNGCVWVSDRLQPFLFEPPCQQDDEYRILMPTEQAFADVEDDQSSILTAPLWQ